jgi:hypothetical protein
MPATLTPLERQIAEAIARALVKEIRSENSREPSENGDAPTGWLPIGAQSITGMDHDRPSKNTTRPTA